MAAIAPAIAPNARARPFSATSKQVRSVCAASLLTALAATPLAAQTQHLDPARIDRAVVAFTGHNVGETGGALNRADTRLRLENCTAPLSVEWHGNRQRAVKVACEARWHIFVAVKAAAQSAPAPPAPDVIRRGDAVTIAIEGRGFAIRRPAEAREGGAIGDWILVKTSRKAEPISAQIVRPGLVSIRL